jgi:hypothetical protein
LLGWLLFGTVALVVIAVVAVIGSGIYYDLTRTKAAEVEDMLDRYLPRASTADQIYTFLDSRGIEHGLVGPADPGDPALQESNVAAGTMTIRAVVRNDGYSLTHKDVEITFILDERGLLKDYVVREMGR